MSSPLNGLIILDGPDGAGKTTLANELCKHAEEQGYKPHYAHLSKPVDAWAEHRDALLDYLELAHGPEKKLVIADRYFMSEAIYGAVYRQGSEYPFAARHFDRLLYRFGALRVVCAPPVEYVTETHAKLKGEREEMYDSGMDTVARMYYDLWYGVDKTSAAIDYRPMSDYVQQLIWQGGVSDKLGWYHYDVTTHGKNMGLCCSSLMLELSRLNTLTKTFSNVEFKNLSGWPRKQAVLLVGDCISDQGSRGMPFLGNSDSSLYLAKTLHKLHADESRVCMVNINDPFGSMTVSEVGSICGRVIALGKNAERALEANNIAYHAKVRHPQHARRFSYHDDGYAHELKQAFAGMAGVF
jgi:nicotinamide riboside kinase